MGLESPDWKSARRSLKYFGTDSPLRRLPNFKPLDDDDEDDMEDDMEERPQTRQKGFRSPGRLAVGRSREEVGRRLSIASRDRDTLNLEISAHGS
eukprot:2889536-Pyramimonas_sp.AAC.1